MDEEVYVHRTSRAVCEKSKAAAKRLARRITRHDLLVALLPPSDECAILVLVEHHPIEHARPLS